MEIFRLFGSIFLKDEEVNKKLDGVDKKAGGVGKTLGQLRDAFGAVGLLAAGYLKGAIESAAKAETSNTRLKTIIENQGESWSTAKKQVDDFKSGIVAMSTYTGGQARDALQVLTEKGVKLGDALKLNTTLADLSAGKTKDMTISANILADAYNGKTRALIGLGLATKEEIKNGISFDEVVKRINERFGGSAAAQLNTYDGKMQQFNNSLSSLKTSIGSYILPVFTSFAGYLSLIAQKINALDPDTKKFIATVLGLTAVFGTLIGGVSLVQSVLGVLGPVATGIGTTIGGLVWPVVAVIAAIALLAAAWANNWGGIKDKTDAVIGWIVPLIKDGFNTVVEWFKVNWPAIKATFEEVFNKISAVVNAVLKPALEFLVKEFGVVVGWVKANWPLIEKTISTIMNAIKAVVELVWSGIKAFWDANGTTILKITSLVWDSIKTVISTVINLVLGILKTVMQVITGDWRGAWETIKKTLSTVWEGIKTLISNQLSIIKTLLTTAWDFIKGATQKVFSGIKTTILGIWDGIVAGIKGAVNLIIGAINSMIKAMNRIKFSIPDWVPNIGGKSWGFNIPTIPKLAAGGNIIRAGSTLVGENGPEILNLPAGASVTPLGKSGVVFERGAFEGATILDDYGVDRLMDRVVERLAVLGVR